MIKRYGKVHLVELKLDRLNELRRDDIDCPWRRWHYDDVRPRRRLYLRHRKDDLRLEHLAHECCGAVARTSHSSKWLLISLLTLYRRAFVSDWWPDAETDVRLVPVGSGGSSPGATMTADPSQFQKAMCAARSPPS